MVRNVLTGWLWDRDYNAPFQPEDECRLADPVERGEVVTFTHASDLACTEVKEHLECGKKCTRIGVTFAEHLAFTVDEAVVIRKLMLLDHVKGAIDAVEREDIAAELSARFALMSGEVGALFDALETNFSLSKPE